MKRFQLALGIAALAGMASPVVAQPAESTMFTAPGEVRVQAGVVIPLGAGGSEAERAPRLEAWSDHRQQRDLPLASLGPSYDPAALRPIRIGVNFSGSPRLMLNGREMPGQDNRKGISTLAVVGIGVVALVVIGVVAASNTEVDLSGCC